MGIMKSLDALIIIHDIKIGLKTKVDVKSNVILIMLFFNYTTGTTVIKVFTNLNLIFE